ncbi:hypothetical protein BIW11_05018, partial [Tropilaelaps mercedesae]
VVAAAAARASAQETDTSKEPVEERTFGKLGFGGSHSAGNSQYDSQSQASGFNQGANAHSQNQQYNNAGGFKNVKGYRENDGFNHQSSNDYGQGFNTNAGAFNKQQGASGQGSGSYGQSSGGSFNSGLGLGLGR